MPLSVGKTPTKPIRLSPFFPTSFGFTHRNFLNLETDFSILSSSLPRLYTSLGHLRRFHLRIQATTGQVTNFHRAFPQSRQLQSGLPGAQHHERNDPRFKCVRSSPA